MNGSLCKIKLTIIYGSFHKLHEHKLGLCYTQQFWALLCKILGLTVIYIHVHYNILIWCCLPVVFYMRTKHQHQMPPKPALSEDKTIYIYYR